MRRSLAPSQRNKSLGSNPLSKFKSPLLKSSGTTKTNGLSSLTKKALKSNNISHLKAKILEKKSNSDENNNTEITKENQIRDDNVNVEETVVPSSKKIKLTGNGYKRPLFTKPISQLSTGKEKLHPKEEEENEDGKSTRKLYYNIVW